MVSPPTIVSSNVKESPSRLYRSWKLMYYYDNASEEIRYDRTKQSIRRSIYQRDSTYPRATPTICIQEEGRIENSSPRKFNKLYLRNRLRQNKAINMTRNGRRVIRILVYGLVYLRFTLSTMI